MSDMDTAALEQVLVGIVDPEIVGLEARIQAVQLMANVAISSSEDGALYGN